MRHAAAPQPTTAAVLNKIQLEFELDRSVDAVAEDATSREIRRHNLKRRMRGTQATLLLFRRGWLSPDTLGRNAGYTYKAKFPRHGTLDPRSQHESNARRLREQALHLHS